MSLTPTTATSHHTTEVDVDGEPVLPAAARLDRRADEGDQCEEDEGHGLVGVTPAAAAGRAARRRRLATRRSRRG